MTFVRSGTLIVLIFYLMVCCCSPIPIRSFTPGRSFGEMFKKYSTPTAVKGFGRLSAAADGEKFNGNIEIRYNDSTDFRITVYTPLGSIGGTIHSFHDSVSINFGTYHRITAFSDTSALLPLLPGNSIPLGEIITLLTGKLLFVDSFHLDGGEEIFESASRNRYVFTTPQWTISVFFSLNGKRLKRILLKHSSGGKEKYTITYKSFSDDAARFVSVRADDGNYFIVTYEKIHHE